MTRHSKKSVRPNIETRLDVPRPYSGIGERIKAFRLSLNMAQEDFYAPLGITNATASRYETGLRSPTIEVLALLREYGADLNQIVTGE